MLAELVKAGKLPPVDQRVGQEPLVIKPLHEIGKYGGTWRRGFTGPATAGTATAAAPAPTICCSGTTPATRSCPTSPRAWRCRTAAARCSLHLRQGHEVVRRRAVHRRRHHVLVRGHLPEQGPGADAVGRMAINGKPGTIEKVDDHHRAVQFPEPYFMFPDVLAGSTDRRWPRVGARYVGLGGYAPAHYLKQFHPKYAEPGRSRQAGEGGEVRQLGADVPEAQERLAAQPRAARSSRPGRRSRRSTRRPGCWSATRTASASTPTGNQLPVHRQVSLTLAENLEVLNLRAIAGEYDLQERHLDIGKLPVFLENQPKGNYTVPSRPRRLRRRLRHQVQPELRGRSRDRQVARQHATSAGRSRSGIDRDQINETFWLGTRHARLGGARRRQPVQPRAGVPDEVVDPRRQDRPTSCWTRSGWTRRTPRGSACVPTARAGCGIEITTVGGQFVPFTRSRDDRRAVEEDRHRADVQEVERWPRR